MHGASVHKEYSVLGAAKSNLCFLVKPISIQLSYPRQNLLLSFFLLGGRTFKIFRISLYPMCAQNLATEGFNLNQNYIRIINYEANQHVPLSSSPKPRQPS
jgi:hypothetical protein